MGSWGFSRDLCRDRNRMSQGEFRWNDLELTWEDDADCFARDVRREEQAQTG